MKEVEKIPKQSFKVIFMTPYAKTVTIRYFTVREKAVKYYNKRIFGFVEFVEFVHFEMSENYEPIGWKTLKLFVNATNVKDRTLKQCLDAQMAL